MTGTDSPILGMILKGYPRISETFISGEILELEKKGIPIEIYSLRRPREDFSHYFVKDIKASVLYVPEYVYSGGIDLFNANWRLFLKAPLRFLNVASKACIRSIERRTLATLRHFLQAGFISWKRLVDRPVVHIHAHFCHTPTSVALFASELIKIPFSFTAHAKDIYTSEPAQLRRKIKRAKFVVTCTKYNKKYMQKIAPSVTTPIYVVYHGVDLTTFTYTHPECPAPPYRILSIGRFVEKKGYDVLLRALKFLRNRSINFQFIHAGDGEERNRILKIAHQLKLEDCTKFMGTLTQEEVISLYRKSHCFVLACKIAKNGDRDGLPNVILEAMATGVPIVSTNVSAIPEAVEHGKTGLLVPPENPELLAKAIEDTLTNYEASRRRAEKARKKVENLFDRKICIENLHVLMKRAIYNS